MKDMFMVIIVIGLGILVAIGAIWGGLQIYKWIAPEYAKVDRQVFENTPSFVQGRISEIRQLEIAYKDKDATPAYKETIRQRVIELSDPDTVWDSLPRDLRSWIGELKTN